MLRLAFKAFDSRGGDEVSADAFTLHRGNLEAWPEGRLIARHVDNEWQVDGRVFFVSSAGRARFACSNRMRRWRSGTAPSTA